MQSAGAVTPRGLAVGRLARGRRARSGRAGAHRQRVAAVGRRQGAGRPRAGRGARGWGHWQGRAGRGAGWGAGSGGGDGRAWCVSRTNGGGGRVSLPLQFRNAAQQWNVQRPTTRAGGPAALVRNSSCHPVADHLGAAAAQVRGALIPLRAGWQRSGEVAQKERHSATTLPAEDGAPRPMVSSGIPLPGCCCCCSWEGSLPPDILVAYASSPQPAAAGWARAGET